MVKSVVKPQTTSTTTVKAYNLHLGNFSKFRSYGIVVVNLGFMTLVTSQVISIAFYSEREKSNKVSSEALISA